MSKPATDGHLNLKGAELLDGPGAVLGLLGHGIAVLFRTMRVASRSALPDLAFVAPHAHSA